MAATQCIKASRRGEDDLLKFKPSIRMGKKWDLSDFKHGRVVGARRAGLMSLDFCCDIQMVGSEFGAKNMKAWIYPALSQWFRLVVVVV